MLEDPKGGRPEEGTPPPAAGGEAEPGPEEDPAARAEREVAEAEQLLRAWEAGSARETGAATPFALTVQPVIGGEEAAITLEGVTSTMSTAELHERVQKEMESKPEPDEQRLFIIDGGKGPLRDETLPIGAYGVVAGETLHLAMRDGRAAAARRAARARLRAAQAAAEAKAAKDAEEAEAKAAHEAREAEEAREDQWRECGACLEAVAKVVASFLAAGVVTTLAVLLVLFIIYYDQGCGGDPCGNRGECSGGLSAQCICTGAYANHTGRFCEITDMIMRSDYNDATVQAVTYTGPDATLSWQLQHELCDAAGRATPGSSATGTATAAAASMQRKLQKNPIEVLARREQLKQHAEKVGRPFCYKGFGKLGVPCGFCSKFPCCSWEELGDTVLKGTIYEGVVQGGR